MYTNKILIVKIIFYLYFKNILRFLSWHARAKTLMLATCMSHKIYFPVRKNVYNNTLTFLNIRNCAKKNWQRDTLGPSAPCSSALIVLFARP